MMLGSTACHPEAVSKLIEAGVNPRAVDDDGATAAFVLLYREPPEDPDGCSGDPSVNDELTARALQELVEVGVDVCATPADAPTDVPRSNAQRWGHGPAVLDVLSATPSCA